TRRIAPGGGIVHPAVLVDGRAVARWRWGRGRETVVVEPFEPLPGGLAAPLEAEVADISRFLGAPQPRLELREAAGSD
ncbi:DNA glycosylase AlkZ-like family protein, partial [Streptomonospora algeriensis]